jgi:hypothetical protein
MIPQSYSLRIGTIAPRRQILRRWVLAWVDAPAAVPATEKG